MDLHEELLMTHPLDGGQALILNLLRTREHLSQLMDERLFRKVGITDAQYNVLRILNGGPAGGYPIREIRRRMVVRNADVPRLVDRMRDAGWVRRSPDPQDGRACRVQLTEAGRQKLADITPQLERFAQSITTALKPEERRQLQSLLDQLRNTLRGEIEKELEGR